MSGHRMAQVAWLLVACACASPALGNGVVRDGVGAVSIGRGGTNIAFSDNTAVLLDNPAGMVGIEERGMVQLGADGLLTDLHYQDPFGADQAAVRPMALPLIGLIRRSEEGTWAWGFGVTAPAGFGAQFAMSDPVFGDQAYSSFGALAKILPGVACQVTDRLSIGATAGIGVSYASLDGPFYMQTGPLRGAPALVDIQGAGAAFIWSLGAQYRLSDNTTVGVCYQSESRFHLEGNSHVDLLAPLPISSGFDSQLDLTWPRSVGIGMVHTIGQRHRLSTDVIYINWSSAFDTMGLHLTNASNPLVTQLLGPEIVDQFPFYWRDSVSVRLGYEYFVTPCTVLRTGYVYNTNQIPDGTLTPYLPATLEHGFSLGLGRTWNSYSVDLAYQYSFGPDRTVGISDLAGGDFNNSVFKSQAHWLGVSLTRRF